MNNNLYANIPTPTHHAAFDERYDYLGYKDFAEAIYNQIAKMQFNNTGITFGVLGEWGMGKTGVLNILDKKLRKHNNFIVVRFDAWQYLRQEELWLAFIRKILHDIYADQNVGDKFLLAVTLNYAIWKNRLEKNPKIGSVLYQYGIKILAFLSLVIFSILGLSFITDNLIYLKNLLYQIGVNEIDLGFLKLNITEWTVLIFWSILIYKIGKSLLLAQIDIKLPPLTKNGFDQGQNIVVDDFKDDFYAIFNALGDEKTIVVLIDDLDRCPPSQIVPVLEAIKHLGFDGSEFASKADMAKIAFVLAIDPTAVEHALAGYFKDYFQGAEKEKDIYQFAKNYIAKIIQVPVILPPLSEDQLRNMLKETFTK